MKSDIGRVFVTGKLGYNSPVGETDIIFEKEFAFQTLFFKCQSRDPVPSITSRLVTAACRVYSLAMA